MAPLTESEKGELRARILHELAETPYACSSLAELTSGTTNFVFRGVLVQPLQDSSPSLSSKSVIIKHSTGYAAVNKDFPLDISRCVSLLRPSLYFRLSVSGLLFSRGFLYVPMPQNP